MFLSVKPKLLDIEIFAQSHMAATWAGGRGGERGRVLLLIWILFPSCEWPNTSPETPKFFIVSGTFEEGGIAGWLLFF